MSTKIETTPLGLARKAIDAAEDDIHDALESWRSSGEEGCAPDDYPYGDFEVELRPDEASLGFAVFFQFSEDPDPEADVFTRKLGAIFEKHGIATVTVLGVHIDSSDVEAFNE